jgi:hypothetical protein
MFIFQICIVNPIVLSNSYRNERRYAENAGSVQECCAEKLGGRAEKRGRVEEWEKQTAGFRSRYQRYNEILR